MAVIVKATWSLEMREVLMLSVYQKIQLIIRVKMCI
jgi:hypothetical protein